MAEPKDNPFLTLRPFAGDLGSRVPRTAFQKDRDRVLYSAAFRRLGGIAQVAASTELPLFHTRLTHSLKVAQVGRRLTEYLRGTDPTLDELGLDPDIVETAGLAHDLGHPPFGHVTDEVLDDLVGNEFGGFEGNAQTFRIVTKLAIKNPTRHVIPDDTPAAERSQRTSLMGLDLTRGTLQAVLKYPVVRGSNLPLATFESRAIPGKCGVYPSESGILGWVREGCSGVNLHPSAVIMDWADDISYALHDVEDHVRTGRLLFDHEVIKRDRPEIMLLFERRAAKKNLAISTGALEAAWTDLTDNLLLPERYDGSLESERNLQSWVNLHIKRFERNVSLQKSEPYVLIPQPELYLVELLKTLTWFYIIKSPPLAASEEGQRRIIETLFDCLMTWITRDPTWQTLPRELRTILICINNAKEHLSASDPAVYLRRRGISDYIASLTETQTYDLYRRLTGEPTGPILGMWLS